jgi:hypothetical protein
MPLCNLLDDGQARASASHLATHCPLKQLKNAVCMCRLDPDPAIANHNPGSVFVLLDMKFQRIRHRL